MPAERLQQVHDNLIVAEFLGSGFSPVTAAQVRQVDKPALLLSGSESPSLFHHLIDRLEKLLPRAQRTIIPGASHIMHEDNPEAFNRAVADFLSAAGS